MKPLLTIGIPTYNRSDELNKRLTDLEKMGYFNHPDVQNIIHDNDSINKDHCLRVKDLQKSVRNLALIESSPNIGMARACYKILAKANGKWILLLGDDDPIILRCAQLLSVLRKNKECDHLYFTPKINEKGKACRIHWLPKLKVGKYTPSFICAKQGFTTGFAFLGSHLFKNKNKLAEKWINSHKNCLFYGHCVMFLESYRKSYYTGITVSAWTPGNERIPFQFNVMRHLELRNLFKYPPSKAIREFTLLNPLEVVKQGVFPLSNHIDHISIEAINKYSRLDQREAITLKEVITIEFNPRDEIHIFPSEKILLPKNCCVFVKKPLQYPIKTSLYFMCGPQAKVLNILRIIAFLKIEGPIYLKGKKSTFSKLYLDSMGIHKNGRLKIIMAYLYSLVFFGPEKFNFDTIFRNALTRPRKGLYKIVLEIEKRPRIALQRMLGKKRYYRIKEVLFGRKHFLRSFRRLKNFP